MSEHRGGGEQNVGGGVQGGLAGVLNDADDEADAHHLHGDVVGDAEHAAGHGDQQQGAAGHAGSAAGSQSGHQAQQKRGGEIHGHTQRVGGSQSQNGDGDGSAGHVDGGAQGDGDRILLLVQAQVLTQGHVHGNVGSGGTGEEGHDAADLDALEDQGIGVLADAQVDDEGVDHQGDEEHTAHQHRNDVDIGAKDREAGGGHGVEHQTQDTEGSAVDDPADGNGQGIGEVCQHTLGVLAGLPQGKTKNHSPHEDADVVGAGQGFGAYPVCSVSTLKRKLYVSKR